MRSESETNGIAERAIHRVKEGTSATLLQFGVDEKWWANSMECKCCLRNVQDLIGQERRFGEAVSGLMFFFGSMVEYHPNSAKDQSRYHRFGKRSYRHLLAYVLNAGGSRKETFLSRTFGSWKI